MGCVPSSRILPIPSLVPDVRLHSQESIDKNNDRQGRTLNKQQVLRLKIARSVLQEYTVDSLIGKGAFSQVLKVTENTTKISFAMKMVKRSEFFQNSSSEMEVLRKLSSAHPNLITLHHFFESSGHIYILTSLAEGGDLFEWLLHHGRFAESCVGSFVLQAVLGVRYLHEQGILHRDVKLENIFVLQRTYNTRLMLGDFGLAHVFPEGSEERSLRGPCGTLEYQAPEAILGQAYGLPVDMWAVGVAMYTLLVGQLPFTHSNEMTLRDLIILSNYRLSREVRDSTSDSCRRVLASLLCHDPHHRMSAHQACLHSWFSS